MRTLGREFNLPGREAMIAGFYRHASVLTSRRHRRRRRLGDAPQGPYPAAAPGDVVRRRPRGTAARGRTTVEPGALGVPADGRTHTVTAKAADRRRGPDPALRKRLTASLTWHVTG